MEARATLRGIFLTAVLCALALAFAACGGRKQPSATSPQLSARNDGSQATEELVSQSIDQTLTELEEMECPAGVDDALWVELKDALNEALQTELTESRPGSPARLLASPEEQDGHSMLCPYKSVATPPTGNTNRIDDLACSLSDGEYVLSWLYRNSGDYDQNGAVGISDITPLAIHFGEDTAPENEWIDGDSDGRVHISDITPIAMYFGANVHYYSVQGSHFFSSQFTEVSQLEFPENAPNDTRLEIQHPIGAEPEYLYWRIVPVDDEGNPGDASNTTEVSAAPPPPVRILSVNPLGGVTGTEITFSAVISGEAPFDYEWNFGGGATPNASTEGSPTVTLDAVDVYDAQLFVENADGSALKRFTLTVTAEPGEPPQIISVSPIEGDSGTEVTFTAEVTGDGPFTYHWDFGGGASPNQSSGVSDQPSATVTLSRGGTLPEPVVTYPASLTVTNSSGTAIHDFNLSISAWWHVEELPVGPNPDCSVYVTIGPDGDVYGLNRNDGTLVLRLINSEWQIEAKLDDGYDSDTWLAFDSQGTISIVGLSSGYPGSSVWFSQYKNDSWTHDYVGTDFWPGYPSLVFDSSDRPVIAYRSLAGGGSMARKTVVATKEGGEWELNVVSEEDEDRITGFFGLDTGPDNRWILGYRVSPTSGGEPPPEVLILRESESGFTRETVMENAWGYDLALTPDGKMVILYGSEGWLRVARETEGDWTFENVAFHVGDVSMAAGPDGTEIVTFTDHGEEGWEDDQAYWAWFHDGEWDIKLLPDPDALGSEAMFHPDGLPVLFTGTKMAMYW